MTRSGSVSARRHANTRILWRKTADAVRVGRAFYQLLLGSLLRCQRLSGIEEILLDALKRDLALPLARLEFIELARAFQHLDILSRVRSGGARGNPVRVGRPCRLVCVGDGGELQDGLLPTIRQFTLGIAEALNLGACRLERTLIGKLLDRQRLFDPRQVADDGAAQANEEAKTSETIHIASRNSRSGTNRLLNMQVLQLSSAAHGCRHAQLQKPSGRAASGIVGEAIRVARFGEP